MISNSKIDKIGASLKKSEPLDERDLRLLLDWRNNFSDTMDYYYKKLSESVSKKERTVLVRRLKRIDSIEKKLKRFSTMRLSTFQDIAGVRLVLKEESQLEKIYTELRVRKSRHTLKRVDDYHKNPKKDGYRGIHLIYQTKESLQVEIQLRTELEHIWATAVEIYGELQKTSFKTGEGDKEWRELFRLLSSYIAILENSPPLEDHLTLSRTKIKSQLKQKIKTLKAIEKLNAATNNIQVTLEKHNKSGRMGKYALIELDIKNNTTKVEVFNKKDQEKAIQIYTEKELRREKDKNYVFINIDEIEKLEISYPNYFLNTKKLLELLSKIILDQV